MRSRARVNRLRPESKELSGTPLAFASAFHESHADVRIHLVQLLVMRACLAQSIAAIFAAIALGLPSAGSVMG